MLRKMILILTLFLCASVALTQPVAPAPSERVAFQVRLLRIPMSVLGDVELTDNPWTGITAPSEDAKKKLTVFTKADLQLDDVKFRADDTGWYINDVDMASPNAEIRGPSDQKVSVINGPHIAIEFGEAASFDISFNPAEYFVPKGDLFELKKCDIPSLIIDTPFARGPDNRLLIKDLVTTASFVSIRKPLPGTSLNVGEPVFTTQTCQMALNILPNKNYGLIMHTGGHGSLILQIRAEIEKEPAKTADPKAGKGK